jgi:MFS family permease
MSDRRLPGAYLLWLSGALVSQVGDAALYFALGWAASASGGTSAGLVLSAVTLPRTVLLVLGGVVGDRVGARRVMIAGDAVMLVLAVALGVAAGQWGTPFPLLVLTGLAVGVVDAFYLPSSGSMPRRLVPGDQLARALALRQSGSQVVSMAGGPLGGAVVALAGFAGAMWADAASFAVVLLVLVAVRAIEPTPPAQRESLLRSALDGVRVVVRTPGLGPALLLVAGAAGLLVPSASLLVPLLARDQRWTAATAGLLIGAQGIGIVVATLSIARRGAAVRRPAVRRPAVRRPAVRRPAVRRPAVRRPAVRRPGVAAAAGLIVAAAGQLALAAAGAPAAALAAILAVGLGTGVFVANLSPVVLGAAPSSHLARVQALSVLVQSTAVLVSLNLLGAVAHAASAAAALLCCAAALAGCGAVALSAPTLRHLTRPILQPEP